MGFSSTNLLPLTSFLLFITLSCPSNFRPAQAQAFPCRRAGATCHALIDYVSPNATTLSAVAALFSAPDHRPLLGPNNLPPTTPPNFPVAARQPIIIPFPCSCASNGTGTSAGRPVYTVVPGDGLYHIAAEVFAGLVTFRQIAAANNISDPDRILVGQDLVIPLPCGCDDVEGRRVVHYGHVAAQGSTVEGIAARYNSSADTLLRLNGLNSSRDLVAGTVVDVPLTPCSSVVNSSSPDYPLLVPNGTYQLTANNCILCRCNAALSSMLQCEPNSTCTAPIRCEGSGDLFLGNTTTSGCNRTACAYAGYNNRTIFTRLASESTCPASSGMSLQGCRWTELLVGVQIIAFCLLFL
ncbi:LysM domain GPI-anchored protein 2 [Striga asiatica]|uniref:LysM domain GPI-anchored protein 2 n=1 Tax=Striga asiatica TaxID=4170 RepID=A0A5A7QBW6_STRAF|nr:LysM domain GPI-anchored protein 2 [Striga asiatica]